ncbi:unnamed protein product, partial [Mesorhabditis belari]|uniref:CXC domain-containing protein n=1 Tax=Mesorhabditis belari TaxID=2138241 RepID=A0AAF3EUS4_9BILA
MEFLLLFSMIILFVDCREILRKQRSAEDAYGPTPPEEKRSFIEKWKDFDQTLALRRERLLKQLRDKVQNASPPSIQPAPPGINRDSYQEIIEESEKPIDVSTVAASAAVETGALSSERAIMTISQGELRELNEMKEVEFVQTTTEMSDEEDCANTNEGSGAQLTLNVEDEAFLNRAVEKVSGEVRTRRPCIDHNGLKEVKPLNAEPTIEASIQEVEKPENYTKLDPSEIQSGESLLKTSAGYGLENVLPKDQQTDKFLAKAAEILENLGSENNSDFENLKLDPYGSILEKRGLNETLEATKLDLDLVKDLADSSFDGIKADSTLSSTDIMIEKLLENGENIFTNDGAFESVKLNWTAPTKGAVIGCPPPKLCAKNCFVTINEKGCQDCQCLWISLTCDNDLDCPEEAQACDMGKCQCRFGWEQDMKRSGYCRGAYPRTARVADPTAKFKSQHRSMGSPLRKVEVAKRFMDAKDESMKLKKLRDPEEFTTAIPASVYFFGRQSHRRKRDTLSRENLKSFEKPRQSERLEWPGPCNDDDSCPEDLYCIQGDCWSLPDKPLQSFTALSDFENRKLSDFSSLTGRGFEHFGLQGFPDFSKEANRQANSFSTKLSNKPSPISKSTHPLAKPRPKKVINVISPPGFLPTSEEELVIRSANSQGKNKDVKMIEIRSRNLRVKPERRRAPAKSTTTSPSPDFVFSPPTTARTSKEPPSFAINDAPNHDDFMQEFWKQKLHLEAPNKFHELEEEVTTAASLDDLEDHEPGVWYEMKPGEFPSFGARPNPSANVPKRSDRMFYEYTKDNLINKPIQILSDNAKGKVQDECSKDSDCSLRTKCCPKKWCDRSQECGNANFCLPDCSLTKMVHQDDGRRPQMDLIYD